MLRLSQNLSLQQKMAPQLIQSLALLQMSTLELELQIKQEMELNPLLEESMEMDLDQDQDQEEEKPAEEGLKEEDELPQELAEDTFDAVLEDQFEQGDYNNERTEYDPNWEVDREPQENRITTIRPLVEELEDQLMLTDLTPQEREIADFIIGNFDGAGYLVCPVEEIAESLQVELETVEYVLSVIQTFDPLGIGARNLQECLTIQLEQRPGVESRWALEIVRHMDDLLKKRFTRIARSLNYSDDQMKRALDVIGTLQPSPGSINREEHSGLLTLDTEVHYTNPDLVVEKVGDDWVVSLTDGHLPSLRINEEYAKQVRNTRLNGASKEKDNDPRSFVSKKLNDARWLLNAIHQRRTTMLKVARYIVSAQMDFFERGGAHIKPMVLQEVADAVGMHVSTISRVSNGKYMETPHGTKELKYFFGSKISSDDGEDVSARSVKERITELIGDENKSKPLSDQEIANVLTKEGLNIARRTVAKYRDQLEINSARYRKKMY
jgi:RNA polymerase sigma-54 factor